MFKTKWMDSTCQLCSLQAACLQPTRLNDDDHDDDGDDNDEMMKHYQDTLHRTQGVVGILLFNS